MIEVPADGSPPDSVMEQQNPTTTTMMRTAAILSLDVVGYSAMARRDDRATVKAWKAREAYLSPVVARHRGTIFNTTGDGFLAAFGSPLDATSCALEIQYHARDYDSKAPDGQKMPLRIGVHVGSVISLGSDLRGDVVNTATRVQSVGVPGEVCVSDAVAQALRAAGGLSLTLHGEFDLKNIGRAPVYRVLSPYPDPAGGTAPRGLPPGRLARHVALAALAAVGIGLEVFVWAAPVDAPPPKGMTRDGEIEFGGTPPGWTRWLPVPSTGPRSPPTATQAEQSSPSSPAKPAAPDPAARPPSGPAVATRPPAAAWPFDGDWQGTLACDQPRGFARPERLTVRRGEIWFQSQDRDSPRRFLLLGTIGADGQSTLRGDGVDAANRTFGATFDVRFVDARLTGRGRTTTGVTCTLEMTRR